MAETAGPAKLGVARYFGPGPPLARALLSPPPDNGSMGRSGVGTVWSTLQATLATDSPTAEGCRASLATFRLVLDAFHRSGQSAGRLFYSRRRSVLGGAVSSESSVWLYAEVLPGSQLALASSTYPASEARRNCLGAVAGVLGAILRRRTVLALMNLRREPAENEYEVVPCFRGKGDYWFRRATMLILCGDALLPSLVRRSRDLVDSDGCRQHFGPSAISNHEREVHEYTACFHRDYIAR